MSYWVALFLAVAANVAANITFKHFIQTTELEPSWTAVRGALGQPSLWLGIVLGLTLLGGYVYALKGIPMSVAYTTATTLSIAAIISAGVFLYGEPFGARMAMGVGAVMVGVFLITTS
jgi:multidrug transporter EmrE-like cation transporter